MIANKEGHTPIVHRPHSEFTPWAVQGTNSPKKDDNRSKSSIVVKDEPITPVAIEPLTVTTVVKNDSPSPQASPQQQNPGKPNLNNKKIEEA